MSEMILTDADLMDASHWPVTVTFGLYDDRDPNCAGVVHGASEGAGVGAGSGTSVRPCGREGRRAPNY